MYETLTPIRSNHETVFLVPRNRLIRKKKKRKSRRNKSISSRLACCRFLHSTATCTLHPSSLRINIFIRTRYECTNVPEIHLRPTQACVSWILGEEETPQYPSGSGRPLALSSRNTISRNTFRLNVIFTSSYPSIIFHSSIVQHSVRCNIYLYSLIF